jgi:hypothetical protein
MTTRNAIIVFAVTEAITIAVLVAAIVLQRS